MSEPPPEEPRPQEVVVIARPVAARVCAWPLTTPKPLDLSFLPRRAALLDLALALLVPLALPILEQLAIGRFLTARRAYLRATDLLILSKWFEALLVLVLAAYFVYRHRIPPASFGLQRERLGRQALWAVPALVGVYAALIPSMVLIGSLVLVFPSLQSDLDHRVEFLRIMPLHDLRSAVLLLIPVAIHEEALFRGLLIPYLRRLTGGWAWAVIASAAIFAALHVGQGWLGVVQVFPVGIVLGIFFVLSRSMMAVIVAHLAFDLIQMQIARLLLPWVERFGQQS